VNFSRWITDITWVPWGLMLGSLFLPIYFNVVQKKKKHNYGKYVLFGDGATIKSTTCNQD